MGRDDLRQHTHRTPGDGGYVDYGAEINNDDDVTTIESDNVNVSGSLTEAASGTTTVPAGTGVDEYLGLTDEAKHYLLTSHPDSGFDDGTSTLNNGYIPNTGQSSAGQSGAALVWDPEEGTDGEWAVWIHNDDDTELQVTWKVWEVA